MLLYATSEVYLTSSRSSIHDDQSFRNCRWLLNNALTTWILFDADNIKLDHQIYPTLSYSAGCFFKKDMQLEGLAWCCLNPKSERQIGTPYEWRGHTQNHRTTWWMHYFVAVRRERESMSRNQVHGKDVVTRSVSCTRVNWDRNRFGFWWLQDSKLSPQFAHQEIRSVCLAGLMIEQVNTDNYLDDLQAGSASPR